MPWSSGNQLVLLRSGTQYFPSLLAAINGARQEVFLESYLYQPDKIGRQVAAALMRAARRGVQVQLLLDGFGARYLPKAFRKSLAKAGVRLLFFRPEYFSLTINLQRLRRMHRKVATIDGKVGFVGGINILEDHDGPDLALRYDYALRVEGPLVAQLRAMVSGQWRHTCWSQLKMEWHKLPRTGPPPVTCGNIKAKLVKRDNLRYRRAIETAYLNAIGNAKQEVVIANAYFLPGVSLQHALLSAARRGVKVVIVLQGRIDQMLLHYATRVLYQPMLKAGVELYEYTAGFMHAKVAVIDNEWLTVGSSNIDPFSLLTAREANIVALDKTLAGALRTDIQSHIDQFATPVHAHLMERAPWWRRALPWIAYQLVRGLLGLTGYGKQEYRE
ncbi:cardiolipin synthase ClsB [Chitinimonas sp. PSY-7]|uniref:cardiolipin synthase ClsB n=1 Tax=Chitinimonas sp. PSY-7 TaxID=3459088 RepID=UPI00403FD641